MTSFFLKGCLCRNTKTFLHSLLFLPILLPIVITMPTYCLCYCESYKTCLQPLFGSICQSCEERERIPWADQTHNWCSTYKRIRPVADFPLDQNNNRTASYCVLCPTTKRLPWAEGGASLKRQTRTAAYTGVTGHWEGFTGRIRKGEDTKGILREETGVGRRGPRRAIYIMGVIKLFA